MIGNGRNPNETGKVATILVCFTDALSTRLVTGQLGFLRDADFEVHVATAVTPEASGPTDDDFVHLRRTLDPGIIPHHVAFVREPSPWRDLRSLLALIVLIRRIRPDLMVVSTPKASLIGMIAAWMCGVPVRVYTVRGFRFETMSGGSRRLFRGFEKIIIGLSHHVVFNSDSLRRLAESEGIISDGRGLVIGSGSGNGIDIGRFSRERLPSQMASRRDLGIPDDAKVIGFVGRLTADKGIDDLVGIFTEELADDERLESIRDNVWLAIVGDQEHGDPVAPLTTKLLSEHPRIVRRSWVDAPESVYPSFDVLAFPSYREGFPNVPLEAQLCGVPVVGYAATGTVDAVRHGETGLLAPVGDRRSFADALVTVLTDDDLRRRMAATATGWVRSTFDRRRVWTELADLYRRWLDQARNS